MGLETKKLGILYINKSNIFLTLFIILINFGCTKSKISQNKNLELSQSPYYAKKLRVDKNGLTHISAILKTVHGEIEIKFFPREAPNSVTRILDLISMGFYNGLTFHRVIPNFIIQTGDPTGTGVGGSGINLPAEFNNIPHIKGTVALARGKENDSADSQIYFALTALPHLDGKNTVIGQVVSGIDFLNKINLGEEIISFSIKDKK